MAKCRSCGAAIDWVVTEAGKRMPVDATPWFVVVPGSAQAPQETVVTMTGQTYKGQVVAECPNSVMADARAQLRNGVHLVVGRRSHFATCKQASQWRKARGQGA